MLSALVFTLSSVPLLEGSKSPTEPVHLAAPSLRTPRAIGKRYDVNDAVRSIVIDVRVEFGNETLYNGPLNLAPGFVTTYTQILNETPALICPGGERYQSTDKRALNIRLSQWHKASEPIQVIVEFVRPAGLAGCAQGGSRTLRTEQWVDLGPGERVDLSGGNEGLGVYLSRR